MTEQPYLMRISFVPMTQCDYRTFLVSNIQRYADLQVQTGTRNPIEALEQARKELGRLLPHGMRSKNQHLLSVQDDETGATVGQVWIGIDDRRAPPCAFVYDLVIQEAFRQRGYGAQVIRALHDLVIALGAARISLKPPDASQG